MATPKRRALVIGVGEPDAVDLNANSYAFPPLPGAERDAEMIERLLVKAGLEEVEIRTTKASTTRAQIGAALDKHISKTTENDLFVFFFAGHGWQVPDNDGDEIDGVADEVLVASDGIIRDDAFPNMWRKLPRGSHLVTMIDSCHSGSIAQGILPIEPEPAPPEHIVPTATEQGPSILSWSACLEEESAFEFGMRGWSEGAFSASFQQAWSNERSRESYGSLWIATQEMFRHLNVRHRQTPCMRLVGPEIHMLDLPPFGIKHS